MRNLSAILLLVLLSFTKPAAAQSEENRIKIQLTITSEGKTTTTDINSLSTSLSRSYEDFGALKDSARKKDDSTTLRAGAYNSFYLSLELKRISDDLLRAFSKKKNRFDGTITITDTYGKIPTRTISFKRAAIYAYSDQVSSMTYGDTYGSASVAIGCETLSINGIPIEQ